MSLSRMQTLGETYVSFIFRGRNAKQEHTHTHTSALHHLTIFSLFQHHYCITLNSALNLPRYASVPLGKQSWIYTNNTYWSSVLQLLKLAGFLKIFSRFAFIFTHAQQSAWRSQIFLEAPCLPGEAFQEVFGAVLGRGKWQKKIAPLHPQNIQAESKPLVQKKAGITLKKT